MKTIIVINDGSSAAVHAAKLAYITAKSIQANILIARICAAQVFVKSKVMAGDSLQQPIPVAVNQLLKHLNDLKDAENGYKPGISTINLPDCNSAELAKVAWEEQAWMIVKGVQANQPANESFNLQTLLNKLPCPLLIVPESWPVKQLERITYLTDLRYCHLNAVRYLANLAAPLNAGLSIAHLSAKGLPDIEESYGIELFTDTVVSQVKGEPIYFNNIREKDVTTAIDVIIYGMQNDILVLINHCSHYKKIFGDHLTNTLPAFITVPLLIFPY